MPPRSPLVTDFRRLKRTFGGNEIVLAVYDDPQLFAKDGQGIRRLSRIRERLLDIPGLKAILSIDQPLRGELIVGDNPLSQRTRELFCGFTHGADQRTVALACMLEPDPRAAVPRSETISRAGHALSAAGSP